MRWAAATVIVSFCATAIGEPDTRQTLNVKTLPRSKSLALVSLWFRQSYRGKKA